MHLIHHDLGAAAAKIRFCFRRTPIVFAHQLIASCLIIRLAAEQIRNFRIVLLNTLLLSLGCIRLRQTEQMNRVSRKARSIPIGGSRYLLQRNRLFFGDVNHGTTNRLGLVPACFTLFRVRQIDKAGIILMFILRVIIQNLRGVDQLFIRLKQHVVDNINHLLLGEACRHFVISENMRHICVALRPAHLRMSFLDILINFSVILYKAHMSAPFNSVWLLPS